MCTRKLLCVLTVLASLVLAVQSFSPCPATGACKILPLGDSITDGVNMEGGYRIQLFHLARQAGRTITFVGSQTNGPSTVDGVAFPRQHEGHSGWNIEQITGLVPAPALNDPPHIVLMMAGTNDRYNFNAAPGKLATLIDKLLSSLSSSSLLVVAKLTPIVGDSNQDAQAVVFNKAIQTMVEQRAAQGKQITWVDMHVLPNSEMADSLHPNAAGYSHMGDIWFAAIRSSLTPGDSTCATATEGQTLSVGCAGGNEITKINFASYGTPTGSCSGGFATSTCHADNSSAILQAKCVGLNSCTVSATNNVFGDPCVTIQKRLSVSVTCAPSPVTCASVGENYALSLNCATGKTIKSIKFASYGTPQGTCSSGFSTSTCHSSTCLSQVQSACVGKNSCSIDANNNVFGDPCSGTYKQLAVSVECA